MYREELEDQCIESIQKVYVALKLTSGKLTLKEYSEYAESHRGFLPWQTIHKILGGPPRWKIYLTPEALAMAGFKMSKPKEVIPEPVVVAGAEVVPVSGTEVEKVVMAEAEKMGLKKRRAAAKATRELCIRSVQIVYIASGRTDGRLSRAEYERYALQRDDVLAFLTIYSKIGGLNVWREYLTPEALKEAGFEVSGAEVPEAPKPELEPKPEPEAPAEESSTEGAATLPEVDKTPVEIPAETVEVVPETLEEVHAEAPEETYVEAPAEEKPVKEVVVVEASVGEAPSEASDGAPVEAPTGMPAPESAVVAVDGETIKVEAGDGAVEINLEIKVNGRTVKVRLEV